MMPGAVIFVGAGDVAWTMRSSIPATHPQEMALTSQPRRISIFMGTSFASPGATPSCPFVFEPHV